ncbi:hypothetical protein PR048_014310 [Dryococelus australis]|uniref:Integrase catalytic domain-containing protein n=1 Tax=Dryococelus australis TaxID=614101 RepID=A0ABQ9HE11_9NEOP|nr:hypothetical protein PR048_014310 [Dryococelus australis]
MPLVGGLSSGFPFPPPLHSCAAPYSSHFSLVGSQDLDVKGIMLLSRDRNHKSTTSKRDKVAFLTESMGGNPEGSWVLDSSCTFHMISNSDSLTNVTCIESEIITPKKNENMCAVLKGAIEYKEYVLKNVLYVPVGGGGGSGYVANKLTDLCRERGIKIDYTPAETPKLNGRAERLNRTLMDKTRALLFDSGLGKELWGEALCTATYLLNRSPSATVDTTPAELWHGKKPDLSNLKLFGSLAHGLHQLITDKSIFVNVEGNLILAIWVDDGLVISNENDKIDEFMMKLQTEF